MIGCHRSHVTPSKRSSVLYMYVCYWLQAMKMQDVARVLTIGVTNNTDEAELRDVIATTPQDYTRVEDFSGLASALDDIIAAVSVS